MATVLYEGPHPAAFMLSEAEGMRSRDTITIESGAGVVKAGTVLAKKTLGTVGSATAGTNTGNGTVGTVTLGSGAKVGTYTVLFTAATKFNVQDPDGNVLKQGTTGVAYADDIGFTITAGGTPFVAGDTFTIAVAAGSAKYVPSTATGATGVQTAVALNLYPVDATSADVDVAGITRDAEVNKNVIIYDASVDDDTKKAAKNTQLAAVGIIVR